MGRIYKRSSFGVLRTNPKLSTNVKIVVDGEGGVFLESIDADPSIARSVYKGYRVNPNGSYSYDLAMFWSQGGQPVPPSSAYYLYERDSSTEVKDRYALQFDDTYWAGVSPKNSRLYKEDLSAFAPLWLEPDSIPDFYVIFRIEGPAAVNAADPSFARVGNKDTSTLLDELVSSPDMFFDNFVSKARIVATFDLTERSSIGRYIRRHASDPAFPSSPIYASLGKGAPSYWRGIAYDRGGFADRTEEVYTEVTLPDRTVMGVDDYFTQGFKRNSIVCANLLNLEFLFDDPTQEKYKFYRYFGLYCSEARLGQFILDGSRLYDDRERENSQVPRPTRDSVGHPWVVADQVQTNPLGVKVYPKCNSLGRPDVGVIPSQADVQRESFLYVRDASGSFHSLGEVGSTVSQDGATGPFMRIKDTSVNWKNFAGFDLSHEAVPARLALTAGRPGLVVRVLESPESGDSLRLLVLDPSSPDVDAYTIIGDASLPEGVSQGLLFSTNGTPQSVARAMAAAVSFIETQVGDVQPFQATSVGDRLIVCSRTASKTWNKIGYAIFTTSPNPPFEVVGVTAQSDTFVPSPASLSSPTSGLLISGTFRGGNDDPSSRIVVSADLYDPIVEDGVFVKLRDGFGRAVSVSPYLDEPVYDSFGRITGFNGVTGLVVVDVDRGGVDLGQTKKVTLHRYRPNYVGALTIYPVKDFDFDFHSVQYAKDADSAPSLLHEWYVAGGASSSPPFDYSLLEPASASLVSEVVGPTSGFVQSGGFGTLEGIVDPFTDDGAPLVNEYDRLKENSIPGFSLPSRVVPFIHKWVYDDLGLDCRENPYRLNADQAFGHCGFSPSFDHMDRDRRFFTHEWLYLQKYPPYMSFEDKVNSFSYFDEEISFPTIPLPGDPDFDSVVAGLTGGTGASSNLLSVADDYFTAYFTRETVDGVRIPRDFRYSIFSEGSSTRHPECMFRGVKVEIQARSEFSPMDWNNETLRKVPGPRYNGYRFSAVMAFADVGNQITFVRNDKWKALTMVVQVEADSPLLTAVGPTGATSRFIDRSSLYTLQHKLEFVGPTAYYADKDMSGGIGNWIDEGTHFTVVGSTSLTGVFPDFALNENGSYNSIRAEGATYSFVFEEVYDLTTTTFKCKRIISSTFDGNPLVPNGTRSLFPDIYYGMWAGSYWLRDLYVDSLRASLTYVGGGYKAYEALFNSVSFAELALKVNRGSPSIKYVSVSDDGRVQYNTYCVSFPPPDYLMKASYMQATQVQDRPIDLQNSTAPIGYELTALPRTEISEIARYRGAYTPKVTDVLLFVDPVKKNDPDIPLSDGGTIYRSLDYLNTTVFTDTERYGWPFASLRGAYFNKVNPENPNIILRSGRGTVLPDIGEIAIDRSDRFVFRSTWDPHYYRKYVKKDRWDPVLGTREPTESKALMGSKVLSIPSVVRLERFPGSTISDVELGDISRASLVDQNVVVGERRVSGRRVLEVSVLVTQALEKWLIDDGFAAEFFRLVDPEYSFGGVGQDDDVREYIRRNVYSRYYVSDIRFYERALTGSQTAPLVNVDLDDRQKAEQGYVQSKSFTTSPIGQEGLDFKLIHNLPPDRRTSVSLTVVLSKK